MISKQQKDCILGGMIDRLFSYEEAQMVYATTVSSGADLKIVTSISDLTGLHPIIDTVDLVSETIGNTEIVIKRGRLTLAGATYVFLRKQILNRKQSMVATIRFGRSLPSVLEAFFQLRFTVSVILQGNVS